MNKVSIHDCRTFCLTWKAYVRDHEINVISLCNYSRKKVDPESFDTLKFNKKSVTRVILH